MIHQEIIQLAEAVSKNKKLLWYLIRATFKVVVKGGVPTSSLHLVLQKKYLRYLDSILYKGSFFNYVEKIWPIIDHLPRWHF